MTPSAVTLGVRGEHMTFGFEHRPFAGLRRRGSDRRLTALHDLVTSPQQLRDHLGMPTSRRSAVVTLTGCVPGLTQTTMRPHLRLA